MRTFETLIKDYVRRLSEEDLCFLHVRFVQMLFGDRAEISDFLSRDRNIDKMLASATDCEDWFDMVECVGDNVKKEYSLRFVTIKN